MWEAVKLPYIFERMIGFSIPKSNRVAVISYEGIHLIEMNSAEVSVRHDYEHAEGGDLYDSDTHLLKYKDQDYEILGLYGGVPILKNYRGEQIILQRGEEEFFVVDAQGNESFCYKYEDLSGDWAHVSFSHDGDSIALGIPYELFLFKRSQHT